MTKTLPAHELNKDTSGDASKVNGKAQEASVPPTTTYNLEMLRAGEIALLRKSTPAGYPIPNGQY